MTPGPPLRGIFSPPETSIGAEHGGQVVSAAFDENQFEVRQLGFEVGNGLQVHRRVFADGGVWAAASFDAANALPG